MPRCRLWWAVALVAASPLLSAAPPPGHPTAAQTMERLRVPAGQGVEQSGRVVESIPSNAFVYVDVELEGGERLWLAAPLAEHRAGSRVGWGGGRKMENFYSRRHQRTFDQVLFVDQLVTLSDEL